MSTASPGSTSRQQDSSINGDSNLTDLQINALLSSTLNSPIKESLDSDITNNTTINNTHHNDNTSGSNPANNDIDLTLFNLLSNESLSSNLGTPTPVPDSSRAPHSHPQPPRSFSSSPPLNHTIIQQKPAMLKKKSIPSSQGVVKREDQNASVNVINSVKMGINGPEEDDDDDEEDENDSSRISLYLRLDFPNFTFYVQTLQVLLGRKIDDENDSSVDVHLASTKAISRKHGKIFYNFGTQRFELSILGRNGAFVDEVFVETGATLPLKNNTKIQIGEIPFQFVLPSPGSSIKKNRKRKQINPSDAIHLKTSLYNNSPRVNKQQLLQQQALPLEQAKNSSIVKAATPGPTQSIIPGNPALVANNSTLTSGLAAQPAAATSTLPNYEAQKKLKLDKPAKKVKQPKKVYTLEEIPEQYRTKPSCSYSHLIAVCLQERSTERGMSLSEIYKGIQDLYPYYFYCPDGWQSSVRHNLSLNKFFKKVSKEGKGWLWGLDEEFYTEKERANANASIHADMHHDIVKKSISEPKMISHHPASSLSTLKNNGSPPPATQNKSIAQLASEIKKPVSTAQFSSTGPINSNSIQAQLAANRAKSSTNVGASSNNSNSNNSNNPSSTPSPTKTAPDSSSSSPNGKLSGDTMKALNYLQQELIRLTKDRKGLDKKTTTQILTQALAMTISQVNQAAKNSGMTGNPLVLLIDKNPLHLTKILTAALNAATYQVTKGKVKPGMVNNNNVGTSTSGSSSPAGSVKLATPRPASVAASRPTTSTYTAPQSSTKPPINDKFRPPHVTNPLPLQLSKPPMTSAQLSRPVQRPPMVSRPVTSGSPVVKKPVIATPTARPAAATLTVIKSEQQLSRSQSPQQVKTPKPAAFSKPALYSPRDANKTGLNSIQTAAGPISVPNAGVKSKLSKPSSYATPPVRMTGPEVNRGGVSASGNSSSSVLSGSSGLDKGNVDNSTVKQAPALPKPEISLNHDPLDDPEFDKVLESFSRQGTPGLDDHMNSEPVDLDKLLAEDGYLNDPFMNEATTGAKRELEHSDQQPLSKIQKTD